MTTTHSEELATYEALFNEADYDALETALRLRAACLGWTGDPLRQPQEVVAACAREVLQARGALASGKP